MLSKVEKYIKEHHLINPGELVIAGVSGGPDSMALLHILNKLQLPLGFKLVVAHVNHGLRTEAAAEEQFVHDYCDSRGIKFYSCQVNVRERAEQEKRSLEEIGRECRYHYFADLSKKLGASRIATAHHQDDNAETVLLNLIRGSGIKGLRGIRPINGKIIRPLLSVNKTEIENYIRENFIPYCIDQSNFSTDYLRNRIRHQLLPLIMQEYNPRFVKSLNQLADIAACENEVIEQEIGRLWAKLIIKEQADEIILDADALSKLHQAYQQRIIMKALFTLHGESGWQSQDILQIKGLLAKPGSAKTLQLKKGLYVRKVYCQIIFGSKPVDKPAFKYRVQVPGQVFIEETGQSYSFSLCESKNYTAQAGDIYLDYDKIKGDLYLRSRQPGDLFAPLGMHGHKKVKDFFIDLKVPLSERDQIPLLATEDKIYAILGYRIARHAAVDATTSRILLVKKTYLKD